MADSIIGATANATPRILNSASITALQSAARVAPTIIQQAQKPAVVKVQSSAVPQTSKSASTALAARSNLPRGSIVDKLV